MRRRASVVRRPLVAWPVGPTRSHGPWSRSERRADGARGGEPVHGGPGRLHHGLRHSSATRRPKVHGERIRSGRPAVWSECRCVSKTIRISNTVSDFRFLTLEQMDQDIRKAGGMAPVRKPVKRGGVTFDFNLAVIGYVVYHFRSRDGQSQGNGAVPVGMKGGRYFFTTRAPVQ